MVRLNSWNLRGSKNKEKGYTLLEIVICILLLTLLMEAFTRVMVKNNEVQNTVSSMENSLVCIQRLLEDVKKQLSEDSIAGEGNLIKKLRPSTLSFEQFFHTEDISKLVSRYCLEQYDYEVAIWDIENMQIENKDLIISQKDLKNACCIRSSTQSSGISDSLEEAIWPSLRMTGQMVGRLREIKDKRIRKSQEDDKNHLNEISIEDEKIKIENISTKVKLEYKEIEQEMGKNYIFDNSTEEVDLEGVSILEVSVNHVDQYDDLTVTFINHLSIDQIICIQGEKPETIDVITEDIGGGRSLILQEENSHHTATQYVIAVIAREKNPMIGEDAKIIKRVMNLYSC